MGRKQNAESAWRDRLAKYSKSRLSVTEFCRQQGVSVASFYQWRKRLSSDEAVQSEPKKTDQAKRASFVPVSVPTTSFVEIEFPDGLRIRVPASNVELLQRAMKAANEVCREAGRC